MLQNINSMSSGSGGGGGRKGRKNISRTIVFERKPLTPTELANGLDNLKLGGTQVTEATLFEDMNLRPDLLKGILAYGWEKPKGFQQKAIPTCIRGEDMILQAQSGMGKTAALAIGILQRIHLNDPVSCQAFVLAPTRELALQITKVFQDLGQFMKIKCLSITGGTRTKMDKEKLSRGGYSIVVGTLGRARSLMEGINGIQYFLTDRIRIFAIDEADKMITDPSFRNDLAYILKEHIPGSSQIISMSATMPELAMDRTKEFMKNPKKFLLRNDELTLEGIRQYFVNVEEERFKMDILMDLKDLIGDNHTMIFANQRHKVDKITGQFKERVRQSGDIDGSEKITSIRGDTDQGLRNASLKDFRIGKSKLIFASDLLGRGIDMQQVSLVINYDLPTMTEEYLHRVGRSGRHGRKGFAITFGQVADLKHIAQFFNTKIEPMPANIYKHVSVK